MKKKLVAEMFSYFNEIGIIAHLSSNEFERSMPDGLTQSQFDVLNWFTRVDTVATPGRLSKAFMVTKGAMTNTLKKLHNKGLIDIVPDENNGRSKIVTMTKQGQAVREKAVMSTEDLMQELLGEISVEELTAQIPVLRKLRVLMDERRYH